MANVFLGLGSNIDAARHIRSALAALQSQFGVLHCSPVYESESIGFDGENFLNMVVGIQTQLSVGDLLTALREIENSLGRDRTAPRFSARSMDIDILLYDDLVGNVDGVTLPRDEILKNAFVLRPLSDLVPDAVHPEKKESYAALWAQYDKKKQKLWRADLELSFS